MPELANGTAYRLSLRQADQAREDFAAIIEELHFVQMQISRQADRVCLSRALMLGFASTWLLIAAVALLLAR
jgi:hypothetical protein